MTLEKAGTALTILDLFKIGIGATTTAVGVSVLFFRALCTNRRLAQNLGRRVFIYCPPDARRANGEIKDMKREVGVLKNSGYFKVDEVVTDFGAIETKMIQDAGIVIVGYDKSMSHFEELVGMVKQHNKPLVVYTFELGFRLTPEHEALFNSYKWSTLSSMPLRLVSDIFAIMASFNYEK